MRLSDYTTEELERLTTLTEKTAKPGEFVRRITTTTFRMRDSHVTDENGYTRPASDADYRGPERRVTSFTDTTQLDPPQAEMLAELARRKAPKPIEGVVYTMSGGWHYRKLDGKWQRKSDTAPASAFTSDCGSMVDWWWENGNLTPVTPQPKAPVFKVGELVVANGGTYKVGRVPSNFADDAWATDYKNVVWMCNGDRDATWEYAEKVRPATDAEVAAYHRAHCQPKVEPVKPVAISNAAHAGQWVKWDNFRCQVLALTDRLGCLPENRVAVVEPDGRIAHVPAVYLTLIDPPVWPK